ncbi:hypothetical protein AYO20_11780 [Fonsecaea nubica]|uniref:Uncharacterized protein n=1 Tax=Fonsecaea nubica TaxID=856822 RepID=A0A178BM37_9EURO|nr:hypothetical protein AYO20_11780 [Fonsecaea nubica]OAL18056.1 hypothetical protein AYO20_11780 [Fonsecaea nubica]
MATADAHDMDKFDADQVRRFFEDMMNSDGRHKWPSMTHYSHAKAHAVRTAQPGAMQAFAEALAAGILDNPEPERRDAILRKYWEATKDWRKANREFLTWWYREKWDPRAMRRLNEHSWFERLSLGEQREEREAEEERWSKKRKTNEEAEEEGIPETTKRLRAASGKAISVPSSDSSKPTGIDDLSMSTPIQLPIRTLKPASTRWKDRP